MRTCTTDGCDNKHRARGLCSTHYNQAHSADRHPKHEQPCAGCARPVIRGKSGSRRNVCSTRCWYFTTYGRWPEAGKEVTGPMPASCAVRKPIPTPAVGLRFIAGSCAWCTTAFVHDMRTTGTVSKYCSRACRKRAGKVRYRLTQGRFDVHPATRLLVYMRDRWTCQLCGDPVDKTLPTQHPLAATLDHIECQSWVPIPDHSPRNLRLAHRICNSLRGDEAYHQAG